MIQVENLHKSFNGTEVLKGISQTLLLGKVVQGKQYSSNHS